MKGPHMDTQTEHDRDLALRAAQAEIDAAYSKRLALILKSRDEGMTNRSIGWALGMTEAAVRAIIRRADADGIMSGPGWEALADDAKTLFVALATSPHLNMAGIVDWSPRKRPNLLMTDDRLDAALTALEAMGMIVADFEADMIFLPSRLKFTVKAVDDYLRLAGSPKIMRACAIELKRKQAESPDLPIWQHKRTRGIVETLGQWA